MVVNFQNEGDLADKYRDSEDFLVALDDMMNDDNLTEIIKIF